MRAVVLLGAAAEARAGDRAADHAAAEHLHHRLGRRADERRLLVAQEVHVRRRVHLAQHAVHVERLVVALEVEALARGRPGRCRRRGCARAPPRPRAGTRRTSSDVVNGGQLGELGVPGGGDGTYGSGRASSSTSSSSRRRLPCVRGVDRVGVGALGHEEHVLDQVEPLAVVVERGDVPGEREHRVGPAERVVRHVREPLDLAHDVVAEVADDATVERRQLGEARRAVAREQRLERGERALVERNVRRARRRGPRPR